MPETVCKSKGAALAALDTIAGTMNRGTPKDVLLAIKAWIDENVQDQLLPEEMQARLKRIFEGTPEEQAGRRWVEQEETNPAYVAGTVKKDGRHYHEMINEPEDGAELTCFWSAITKKWEPCEAWPPIEHQQEYNPEDDQG